MKAILLTAQRADWLYLKAIINQSVFVIPILKKNKKLKMWHWSLVGPVIGCKIDSPMAYSRIKLLYETLRFLYHYRLQHISQPLLKISTILLNYP